MATKTFLAIFTLLLLTTQISANDCSGVVCDSTQNYCVAKNVCVCNGNNFRAEFGKDESGEYFQSCVDLRGANQLWGWGVAILVMVVSVGSCGVIEYSINKKGGEVRSPRE